MPCEGLTGGVFPEPAAPELDPPPPDPPETPAVGLLPPAPPPVDVILEKVELDPLVPVPGLPAPPLPTAIVNPVTDTGKAATQDPKGLAV